MNINDYPKSVQEAIMREAKKNNVSPEEVIRHNLKLLAGKIAVYHPKG